MIALEVGVFDFGYSCIAGLVYLCSVPFTFIGVLFTIWLPALSASSMQFAQSMRDWAQPWSLSDPAVTDLSDPEVFGICLAAVFAALFLRLAWSMLVYHALNTKYNVTQMERMFQPSAIGAQLRPGRLAVIAALIGISEHPHLGPAWSRKSLPPTLLRYDHGEQANLSSLLGSDRLKWLLPIL